MSYVRVGMGAIGPRAPRGGRVIRVPRIRGLGQTPTCVSCQAIAAGPEGYGADYNACIANCTGPGYTPAQEQAVEAGSGLVTYQSVAPDGSIWLQTIPAGQSPPSGATLAPPGATPLNVQQQQGLSPLPAGFPFCVGTVTKPGIFPCGTPGKSSIASQSGWVYNAATGTYGPPTTAAPTTPAAAAPAAAAPASTTPGGPVSTSEISSPGGGSSTLLGSSPGGESFIAGPAGGTLSGSCFNPLSAWMPDPCLGPIGAAEIAAGVLGVFLLFSLMGGHKR